MTALPYDPALDPPAPRRRASLWPREHGTYVQLLAPLLAALLAITPTVASVLLVIASCAAFLATEAVLVARGGRGHRRQALDGAHANRRARWLGAVVIGAGCAGLVLAPQSAIELAGLVALPATIAIVLATRRSIHTLAGEVVAAIALAGASAPVVAASGMSRADALAWWLVWSAGFATTVIAVRGVIARHRKASRLEARTDAHLAAYVVAGVLAFAMPMTAIALPLMLSAIVISLLAPSAKRLRSVGVALAVAATASTVLAIVLV
jgi:hypothetical protein